MRSRGSIQPKFIKPASKALVFIFVCMIVFSMTVNPVEAGFFSFIKNIFGEGDSESQTALLSRNMGLLSAPVNSDLSAGTGGGDITIVQDSAIYPITGPLGNIIEAEEETKRSGQISIYVVREGDTLSQIADMFGVSVNTIIWANNNIKRGDLIIPEQVLVILPVSGIKYEVEEGDTLSDIAKEFNGNVEEIRQFNDLPEGVVLSAGDTVIVPNGEAPVPVYTRSSPSRAYYAGYYVRPINGGTKTQRIHGYNGVDLASYCGAPVFASASGSVIISRASGWNGGYGKYLVVSHTNGTQTLYSHLSSVIVGAGRGVVQGQVLGYMGSTGQSTGCHVHFEVRGAVNPF